MARVRKPSPTPPPDPFPWAAIKADTLRTICAQLLDYASTSPSPSTPKNGYETKSASTSARTPGSPSKTSIADALKQSRQRLRSRKDMVSFLEGVNEFGLLEAVRRFQFQSEDGNASEAGEADEDQQPPQQTLSTPNQRTTRSSQAGTSPRKRRRNDLSDNDQEGTRPAPSTPPPIATLPRTPATPQTPYNTRFKGVKRVRVSEKQISPTVSELESAVRRSESKEYQNGEQSGSDDSDSDDDDGFGEELIPSRPRRSAREKEHQQDLQKSPKSYFDSQTRPEVTQGQRRTERRARATVYQGRGRPRKSDLQTSHRQTKSRSIPPTERRPRGRPRKDSLRAGDQVAVDLARAITLSHAATEQGHDSMALDGEADADAEGDTDHEVDAAELGPEEESPTHPSGIRRARNATSRGATTLPAVKRGRGRPRKNPIPRTHEEGTSNLKQNVYVSVPTRLATKTRLAATASTSAGKSSHSQPAGHAPHLPGSLFEGVFLPPPVTGKRVITDVAAAGIVAGTDGADASTSGNVDLGVGAGERPVLKERKDLSGGQEVEGGEEGVETQLDEVPPSEEQESEQGQEQEEEPNPDHALSTDLDFDQEQDFDPVLEGLVKGDTLSSLAGSNKENEFLDVEGADVEDESPTRVGLGDTAGTFNQTRVVNEVQARVAGTDSPRGGAISPEL